MKMLLLLLIISIIYVGVKKGIWMVGDKPRVVVHILNPTNTWGKGDFYVNRTGYV